MKQKIIDKYDTWNVALAHETYIRDSITHCLPQATGIECARVRRGPAMSY